MKKENLIAAVIKAGENKKLCEKIERKNFSFICFSSVMEILEKSDSSKISIILVDSEINNEEIRKLPQKINSSKKIFKTLFVILIEKQEFSLISEFKNYGYEDFIFKEMEKDELNYKLGRLLKFNELENNFQRAVRYIKSKKGELEESEKDSEEVMIQRGRLETLGMITAGIMHEITTPVQYVSDNMNFLRDSFLKFIEPLNKISGSIKKNSQAIQEMQNFLRKLDWDYLKNEIPDAFNQSIDGIDKITEILLSVRNISRQNVFEQINSDINEIIRKSVIITKSIWKHCASVKMELSPEIPKINCQPIALNQVFVNLIVNAAQAIEEKNKEKGNFIKIETGVSKNSIFIKFIDTGKGITDENIKSIFNPFFTTKGVGKGTGQGLSISKAIIERHNGTISVSSKPGRGSSFFISLPTDIESKSEKEAEVNEADILLKDDFSHEKPFILFVDEDKEMLSGLSRMFKSMEGQWRFEFVENGKQALFIMEQTPADIIISEYNMRGFELLKKIKENFPQTDRIFLSGETDEKKIMEGISIANQFISKPVNSEKLKNILKRNLAIQNLLKDKNLKKIISQIDKLPNVPHIYKEIVNELNSDISSTKSIGNIIEKDPSMSSKIIQVVNSGFFYNSSKISNPSEAVVLLGIEIVKSLVLQIGIFSGLKLQSSFSGFQKNLYNHSIETAYIARDISKMEGLSSFKCDQAFMTGLIHGCGKLALASKFPDEYKLVIENAKKNKTFLFTEENNIFGVSHAVVGAFLMGTWGLPLKIIESLLYYHNPSSSSDEHFDVTAAVHIAHNISKERKQKTNICYENMYDMKFIKKLGLEEKLEKWRGFKEE